MYFFVSCICIIIKMIYFYFKENMSFARMPRSFTDKCEHTKQPLLVKS